MVSAFFTPPLRRLNLVAAATAASALVVQKSTGSLSEGQPQQPPPPSLRVLHESLVTGPLARRYAATPLGGTNWGLSFASSDLRSKARSSQLQIFDVASDAPRSSAMLLPADGTEVTRSPRHGLEFRRTTYDDGKKVAVEVWLSSGVRLARSTVDGVGAKGLAPGVFGRPQFSPSGHVVCWVAERKPADAEAKGYWPAADTAKDGGGAAAAAAAADDDAAPLLGKYPLADARSTGEALLVHNTVLCVWDWRAGTLRVIAPEAVLPEGSLPANGVAVAAHAVFDGTDDGVVFGCHLLPPWCVRTRSREMAAGRARSGRLHNDESRCGRMNGGAEVRRVA